MFVFAARIMTFARIGWVNPRPDGGQSGPLRTHCTKLGLGFDDLVTKGSTFKGKCVACNKCPSFTVLYNTKTKEVQWACRECKDKFEWHSTNRGKCYVCGTEPVMPLPSDVRDPTARGQQHYDTCAACTPRVRTVFTGCPACDLLFEGDVCMRHELIAGTLAQCARCAVIHRGSHTCGTAAPTNTHTH